MNKKILLALGIFALVLTSGCITGEEDVETPFLTDVDITQNPTAKCIELCQAVKEEGTDLSAGPCLSDYNPDWEIEDWVCDVAHDPWGGPDELPENQCREFRLGIAKHFVEVDENCDLLRTH